MSKPIIAIVANIEYDKNYLFPGYPRIQINQDYSRAIEEAGGVPILIGPSECHSNIERQLSFCDGVVFSGGQDINPLLYGEQPNEKLGGLSPIRDAFEMKAYEIAEKIKKPILGICRGSQIINVCNGGTLYQDIRDFGTEMKHMHHGNPDMPVHDITVSEGTHLYAALSRTTVAVNSFHHQSIKAVAPGFRISATSTDGIIEGIEKVSDDHFVMAVQWHPEMMSKTSEDAKNIFKYFLSQMG